MHLDFHLSTTEWNAPALIIPESSDTWSFARGMAISIGQDLYADRLNRVSSSARNVEASANSSWHFEEGMNADFWEPKRKYASGSLPNVVVVIGSNSANPGVRGEAADMDPKSPTYRYGNYGEKIRKYRSPLVTTTEQANAMAAYILSRELGPSDEVTLSALPNPLLDPGDTISVTRERIGLLGRRLLVSRLEIPLLAEKGMTVVGRRSIQTYDDQTAFIGA